MAIDVNELLAPIPGGDPAGSDASFSDQFDRIREARKTCGIAQTALFLDDIKELGFKMAFKGGLSFNLNDVLIPALPGFGERGQG